MIVSSLLPSAALPNAARIQSELMAPRGSLGVAISSRMVAGTENRQHPTAGREVTHIEASLPPGWHQIEPHTVIRGIMGFISAKTAWLGPSLF